MVASEKSDSVWIFHLQTQQILKGFNRVISSIHKVSDEDVASLLDVSS